MFVGFLRWIVAEIIQSRKSYLPELTIKVCHNMNKLILVRVWYAHWIFRLGSDNEFGYRLDKTIPKIREIKINIIYNR